jgi:predicted metal-dependent peptidase
MDAPQKLKKAKIQLVLDHPFFGSLALKMPLIPAPGIGTFRTNGQWIKYDPEYVDTLSLDECKGVIAHECMHPAMLHHTRQDGRDPKDWNISTDYAINPHLVESGLTLPAGVLLDTRYSGKSAEEIYGQVHQKPDPDGPEEGPQGQGEGEGDGDGDGDGNQQPDPNAPPQNKPGQNPNDPGGTGEVEPAPTGEQQTQDNEWRVNIAQAAQAAKAAGKLPAGLARLVEETLNPKADWRELLRSFVERNARNDYNWTRPNRRHMQRGFYLPTLISEELPPIAVAIDTSGSCYGLQEQFLAELSEMLEAYRTHVTVLYVDCQIAHVSEFDSDDLPIPLETHGGGGTSFRPPFEWLADHEETPACLIYLTDLYGDFPDEAPDYPVLWATGESGGQTPPWGEHIELVP